MLKVNKTNSMKSSKISDGYSSDGVMAKNCLGIYLISHKQYGILQNGKDRRDEKSKIKNNNNNDNNITMWHRNLSIFSSDIFGVAVHPLRHLSTKECLIQNGCSSHSTSNYTQQAYTLFTKHFCDKLLWLWLRRRVNCDCVVVSLHVY